MWSGANPALLYSGSTIDLHTISCSPADHCPQFVLSDSRGKYFGYGPPCRFAHCHTLFPPFAFTECIGYSPLQVCALPHCCELDTHELAGHVCRAWRVQWWASGVRMERGKPSSLTTLCAPACCSRGWHPSGDVASLGMLANSHSINAAQQHLHCGARPLLRNAVCWFVCEGLV